MLSPQITMTTALAKEELWLIGTELFAIAWTFANSAAYPAVDGVYVAIGTYVGSGCVRIAWWAATCQPWLTDTRAASVAAGSLSGGVRQPSRYTNSSINTSSSSTPSIVT